MNEIQSEIQFDPYTQKISLDSEPQIKVISWKKKKKLKMFSKEFKMYSVPLQFRYLICLLIRKVKCSTNFLFIFFDTYAYIKLFHKIKC